MFVGIDSGGTHTRGIVADASGTILKNYSGPGANPKDKGWQAAYAIYKDCLNELLDNDLSKLERCCITAAGVGDSTPNSQKAWSTALSVPLEKIIIIGDAYTAHLGAFLGQDGIMVVAGTGATLVGRKGETFKRLGGWGHILGDLGSGYAIGLAGLRQAVIDSDLAHNSKLFKAMQNCYQLENVPELLEHVHASPKAEVAKFSKDVLDLAAHNHEPSQLILQDQFNFLSLMLTQFEALGFEKNVSYIGGLFSHPYFMSTFSDLLNDLGFQLIPPQSSALEAALQIALGNLNIDVNFK